MKLSVVIAVYFYARNSFSLSQYIIKISNYEFDWKFYEIECDKA